MPGGEKIGETEDGPEDKRDENEDKKYGADPAGERRRTAESGRRRRMASGPEKGKTGPGKTRGENDRREAET